MDQALIDEAISKIDLGKWSMSDERAFMENLFVSRFNSFLVVFSLFVTAGFANNFSSFKWTVFIARALVLTIVWLSLFRAYKKYDRIIKLLSGEAAHPICQVNGLLEIDRKPIQKRLAKLLYFRASWVMGVLTPAVCILALVFAGWAIQVGLLKSV